ncbi:TonB-dependent receptor (plasmid) [Novosphingobium sp. BL-8A]|uniref:TonB-dependent receptor n=1 Tax=Novosphingobium sp. BL-8A TaxID=3127639 RepID=UPI0037573A71
MTAIVVALATANPAFADEQPVKQPDEQGRGTVSVAPGDIIVTARKRQETQLDVPVIEQVVSSETLARQQTLDLKDLTKLTPGLMIGTAVLSIGQQVTLRGVGTSSFDPGIDQSVSLNIDGLSLGQGLAFTSGMFDVGQVEVLKGPQSLFYGKSSPGGVIAIHTADPTDQLEVKGSAGYEAEAHAMRFEGVVSGPLSDTLKARIAGVYSKTDGYYYNDAVIPSTATFSPAPGVSLPVSALGGLSPRFSRTGRGDSYQVRGTLIWDPSWRFNAKLKVNLVHDKSYNAENGQLKSCPDGVGGVPAYGNAPFINPNDNCKLDRVGYIVGMNPANFVGLGKDNETSYIESTQRYGVLELNYNLTDDVTATSVTGYYNLHSDSALNPSLSGFSGPLLAVTNPRFRRSDFTEEVRFNSNFSGPFNFTLGGFYQDGKVSDRVTLYANNFFVPAAASGIPLQDGLNRFDIETYSAFGQVRYKITPEIELAGGVRVTNEKREQDPLLYYSLTNLGAGLPVTPTTPYIVPVKTPRVNSTRSSPEVTITYKPTQDLNIFASYKVAYKSGSFSIATPQTLNADGWLDNSFGDEKVTGFEGGIKGRTFNNQLSFTLAGFDYKYTGLQVGGIEPTVGSIPVIRTVNAGSGRSYGAEAEAHFRPAALEGLTLNAAVNYTHARFKTLNNVPCYGGQTIANGCDQEFVPSPDQASPGAGAVTVNGLKGFYFAQDLSGSPFLRAPDWSGNVGFDYEIPIGNWKLIVSNNNYLTSKFLTGPGKREDFYQSGYAKVDAGLTLQGPDNRWEVALIGKNLTKQYTASNCSPSNFQNGLLGGQITGGNAAGPAGVDEMLCYMDPGRELWIRLTLRPFG